MYRNNNSAIICFRNFCQIMYCINMIMEDLNNLLNPKYIEVYGLFNPRGGISIKPFANTGDDKTFVEKRKGEYIK